MLNNKIVQIFLFILILAGIIKGSYWLTKYNIDKQRNSAETVAGIYGIYSEKNNKITPNVFETHVGVGENMGCKLDDAFVTRIDKKQYPLLYKMLYKKNGGYCGVYSHILSMFHTFGQKELMLDSVKYPVQDPADGTKLNLKLVEAYLDLFPELRDGVTDDETINIYATYGKKCTITEFKSTDYQSVCEKAIVAKKNGADCELGLFSDLTGGHSVNIKGASWNPKKKQCEITVRSTGGQYDPQINPTLDKVNISIYKKGYYPIVQSFGTDESIYEDGASLICCK